MCHYSVTDFFLNLIFQDHLPSPVPSFRTKNTNLLKIQTFRTILITLIFIYFRTIIAHYSKFKPFSTRFQDHSRPLSLCTSMYLFLLDKWHSYACKCVFFFRVWNTHFYFDFYCKPAYCCLFWLNFMVIVMYFNFKVRRFHCIVTTVLWFQN